MSAETTPRPGRRRAVRFNPGRDTAIAAGTLLGLWLTYYLGSLPGLDWVLLVGIIVFGTIIPAWTVFHLLKGDWADLGITGRRLVLSLIVSAVLGAGSVYQALTLARAQNVDPVPHLLGNVLVFWEPLFVFGWLFLRWEKAFGWLPAIPLVGLGFTLQHVGAVPFPTALGFGAFGVFFAVIFALTRNLLILWPLFYGVASGIGTLQAGFTFGWDEVLSSAILLVAQIAILVGIHRWARARTRSV